METENQVELRQRIGASFRRYREALPDVGRAYEALPAVAYRDGALDGRTKRLMALAVALTHGCRGCLLAQAEYALEAGASVDEVLETCAVAVSMGGTMASAETAWVVEYLEQSGLM